MNLSSKLSEINNIDNNTNVTNIPYHYPPRYTPESDSNIYSVVLEEINNSLQKNKFIVSKWDIKNEEHICYVWNSEKILLGNISIIFNQNQEHNLIPYNANINVQTKNNIFNNWIKLYANPSSGNNKINYQKTFNLDKKLAFKNLCNEIVEIFTPIPFYRRMNIWNILDGSIFVTYPNKDDEL